MEVATVEGKKSDTQNGYKRTEIGVIPEDWSLLTIDELIEVGFLEKPLDGNHGNIHPRGSDFIDSGIPFLLANNIKNGSVDTSTCKFISEKQADTLKKGFSYEGDVLLTHKGTVGNVALLNKTEKEYLMLSPQVTYYRVADKNKLSNKYLKSFFEGYFFQQAIKDYSSGGTRAYIGISKQKSLPITLPPTLSEQRAIAGALSDVDDLIAELEGLIQKKQQIKKGAMQQLLTGKKRLPGFEGEWEEKKLGEVLYVQGGYAFKSVNFQKFGIPIVRISNIQNGGINLEESVFYSSKEHIPNEFKIKKGEALIAMSGATTGKVGLYDQDKSSYQNQRVGKFVVNDSSKTDETYILHLVNSDVFRRILSKELEQGAQPNVSGKQLEGLVFDMPNEIEEQKAIAQILSDMDAEIQSLEAKREKYQRIKQGMMQELLTGKTRLVG
jgi:type I restriction enzyme S subunit